jgi:hypothetical protein
MSTEWLEFAELILSNELNIEKTSNYQKEMDSVQYDCRLFLLISGDGTPRDRWT